MIITIRTAFSRPESNRQNFRVECREDSSEGGFGENIVAVFDLPKDGLNPSAILSEATGAIRQASTEPNNIESERIGRRPES